MIDNFLKLKNIQKKYIDASKNIQVLKGVNLSLGKNNIVSLIGPSGSGKSTLLHILGLLETVDQGEYFLTLKNYQSYFNPLIGLSLEAVIAGYKLAKKVIRTEKKQIIKTDL